MQEAQEAMENATTLRLLHLFEAHGHQICPTVENPCIDPEDSCYAGWIDAGVLKSAFHHGMRPGEYTFYKTDMHFSAHVNSLLFKEQTYCYGPRGLYIKSYEAAATHLRGSRLTLAPPGGCPCLEGFVPNLTGFWAERAKVLRLTEVQECDEQGCLMKVTARLSFSLHTGAGG